MPLDEDRQVFEELRDELLQHHQGEYALIVDEELVGTYDHEEDAYEKGVKQYGNRPMYIKKIVAEDEEEVDLLPALTLGLIDANN